MTDHRHRAAAHSVRSCFQAQRFGWAGLGDPEHVVHASNQSGSIGRTDARGGEDGLGHAPQYSGGRKRAQCTRSIMWMCHAMSRRRMRHFSMRLVAYIAYI